MFGEIPDRVQVLKLSAIADAHRQRYLGQGGFGETHRTGRSQSRGCGNAVGNKWVAKAQFINCHCRPWKINRFVVTVPASPQRAWNLVSSLVSCDSHMKGTGWDWKEASAGSSQENGEYNSCAVKARSLLAAMIPPDSSTVKPPSDATTCVSSPSVPVVA